MLDDRHRSLAPHSPGSIALVGRKANGPPMPAQGRSVGRLMSGSSQKETSKAASLAHSGRRMERLVDRQEHLGSTQSPGGERTFILGRTGGGRRTSGNGFRFLYTGRRFVASAIERVPDGHSQAKGTRAG